MSKVVENAYKSYILYLKRKYKSTRKGKRKIKKTLNKILLMYKRYKVRGVKKVDLLFAKRYYSTISKSKKRLFYVSVINKMLKRYQVVREVVKIEKKKNFLHTKSYVRELENVNIYEYVFCIYDLNKNVIYDILDYSVKNDIIFDDDIAYFVLSYLCFNYDDISNSLNKVAFDELKLIVDSQDIQRYFRFEKDYVYKTDYVQTNAFEFSKKAIDRISETILNMLKIYESYSCYDTLAYSLTIRIHKEK